MSPTSRSAQRSTEALKVAISELGGSPRDGQERMVEAVAETIDDGSHLLVQAGTGTGKSLGYLIPTMVHAMDSGERVVVSTATLALQRQILTKDAPLAAEAAAEVTGKHPSVAVLKGWHNYVCKHRLAGGYPDDATDSLFGASEFSANKAGEGALSSLGEEVLRLREWAESTTTGDRDDLVPGVSQRAWAQVSVSKNECIGSTCPLRDECFPELARNQAAEADIVITNHSILGVAASGNAGLLPDYEVLVVDEAHELADRVREQGSVSLSAASVVRVASVARAQAGVVASDLEAAGQSLQLALAEMEDGRLAGGLPPALHEALVMVDAEARDCMEQLRERAKGSSKDLEAMAGLTLARTALTELIDAVDRLTSDSVAARRDVAWVERPRMGEDPPRLNLAPIDVASSLADELINERASIFTSATLSLGGRFEAMAVSLGLTLAAEPWRGLDVGTPFDYAKQGILYTPTHLPRPGMGVSQEALEEMLDLVRASGGGMLGLFSSRRGAEEAAELLRAETDFPIYAQGEDQLPTLVQAFADDEDACLVGTLSLWQGVDVPGRTCRLVVMDRIPFPRPDDPVAQAHSEAITAAGGNGFMGVSATHAALLLAQGAGRLIRRSDDKGVVAVLDPRLRTARYGSYLGRSMPPLWVTQDHDVVVAALQRLNASQD